jgi:PIN domain nuclease of toxin-antitoxin system
MKLLLDTHTFIWWDNEPDKLSTKVLDLCQDPNNRLILSVVSIWEMQIKSQLGKLTLNQSLADLIERQQGRNQIEILSIELPHILALNELPTHHKDPFDRLLIAQANIENAVLLSKDAVFSAYSVNVLWK